jgi:hypothetical protein
MQTPFTSAAKELILYLVSLVPLPAPQLSLYSPYCLELFASPPLLTAMSFSFAFAYLLSDTSQPQDTTDDGPSYSIYRDFI